MERSSVFRVVVGMTLAAALAACTTPDEAGRSPDRAADAVGAPSERTPADVLVLGTPDGPLLVDAGTAEPIGDGTATLTALDGSRVYASTPSGNATQVITRDAATGAVMGRTDVAGRFEVRVASVDGGAVALTEPLPEGVHPWTPIPRATTTIVVADPSGVEDPRRLRLDGNFEPEAFSLDERKLFLIQHLPAEAPTAYRVTFLDLETGDVRPVKGRFKVPPQRMPGVRLHQVYDPVRAQLYTLYANDAGAWDGRSAAGGGDRGAGSSGSYGGTYGGAYGGGSGVAGGEPAGAVGAERETFVHVLNLRNGWAFCAGVPRAMWGERPRAQALATSPDGTLLYLVDSVQGLVAEMDTRSLEIVRARDVELGSLRGARTSAAVSRDGAVLYVGSAADGRAVYAIDTDTLEPVARWPVEASVRDLGLSVDGRRLYAALEDGIALLDPSDGASLGTVAIGGIDEILHVATPAPPG